MQDPCTIHHSEATPTSPQIHQHLFRKLLQSAAASMCLSFRLRSSIKGAFRSRHRILAGSHPLCEKPGNPCFGGWECIPIPVFVSHSVFLLLEACPAVISDWVYFSALTASPNPGWALKPRPVQCPIFGCLAFLAQFLKKRSNEVPVYVAFNESSSPSHFYSSKNWLSVYF